MTPTDRKVIEILRRYPEGTMISQICRAEGIKLNVMYERLARAHSRGILVRSKGRGSWGGWAIAPGDPIAVGSLSARPARIRKILRLKG